MRRVAAPACDSTPHARRTINAEQLLFCGVQKTMIRNIRQICGVTALVGMLTTSSLAAQPLRSTSTRVAPPKAPPIQLLQWSLLPSWMTLRMELRGRTEDQTAYNYMTGNGRVYELTRV